MSLSQPILEEFLTKEELAAELRRNPRTLDRWEALGIGPPRTHVGRKILYRRASLQKWLVACEHHGHGDNEAEEKSKARERSAVA
jgi:hypothetical protein